MPLKALFLVLSKENVASSHVGNTFLKIHFSVKLVINH